MRDPHKADAQKAQNDGTRRTRVLIADDHPDVRDGLVTLLEDRFDIVGAVSDGSQLIAAAVRLRPDIIITDISMPVLCGLEAIRHLRGLWKDAKVIVLTMHADAAVATEAIKAGASGFLAKHATGEELEKAIDQVLQGGVYVTPDGRPSKPTGPG